MTENQRRHAERAAADKIRRANKRAMNNARSVAIQKQRLRKVVRP